MTSKIDGWCLFNEAQVPVIQTMRFSSEGCFAASSEQGFTRIPDWPKFRIKPVKIIPHDTWERLLEWCASNCSYEAVEPLRGILAEAGVAKRKSLPYWDDKFGKKRKR